MIARRSVVQEPAALRTRRISESGEPPARRTSRCYSDTGSSIASLRRAALAKPRVEYENSYRSEPSVVFPGSRASKIIQRIIDSRLTGMKYDHDVCKALCNQLSDVIKDELRREVVDVPRYKLICWVTIGQVSGQDVRVVSRCLWDTEHDRCGSASFQNPHLWAVATVFAVYHDGCFNLATE